MTDAAAPTRTPTHLWIVGILSLLWNAMGAFDYSASQLGVESYLSQFTPEQREYFEAFPAWAVAGWAFGVWGALAGSLGLLLRKAWSFSAFAVSLAGLAISSIYNFLLTDGAAVMGTGGVVFSLVIWLVAILLLLYARNQKRAGVLA